MAIASIHIASFISAMVMTVISSVKVLSHAKVFREIIVEILIEIIIKIIEVISIKIVSSPIIVAVVVISTFPSPLATLSATVVWTAEIWVVPTAWLMTSASAMSEICIKIHFILLNVSKNCFASISYSVKDCFFASLAILGTVVGSGFISGKEIFVFFSRFGIFSFPCIFLAFILFFLVFRMLLSIGEMALEKLKKSKFAFIINLFLCLFFASAMFAGITNLLTFDKKIISLLIFAVILLLCYLVFKFGMGSLNKMNIIFVPLMIVIFITLLCTKIDFKLLELEPVTKIGGVSFIYTILYIVLNTANGGVLIANLGEKLSKRQKTQVAFFSALTLSVVLLIANVVLLLNPASFAYAMPLVSIFSGSRHFIMTFVVFIGCLTTLLTLVYSLSSSMRGLCKNEYIIFFTSVVVPFILSLIGFSFIVEYLYPVASILGIYLLCELSFIPLFKRANKKIHSASKHT